MKDGVGRVTCGLYKTPGPCAMSQIFGKSPARLPEAMTFSSSPPIFTLCPAARSGNSGAKGRRYAVGCVFGVAVGVVD